jgi:hypothetical protein
MSEALRDGIGWDRRRRIVGTRGKKTMEERQRREIRI